jgi:hypothetical protein
MWIRADGVFEPIVDRLLFDAPQPHRTNRHAARKKNNPREI